MKMIAKKQMSKVVTSITAREDARVDERPECC
jgi:hypothetical protein